MKMSAFYPAECQGSTHRPSSLLGSELQPQNKISADTSRRGFNGRYGGGVWASRKQKEAKISESVGFAPWKWPKAQEVGRCITVL